MRDVACQHADVDLTTAELGRRIRAARKARNVSQAELAERMGIAARTVYAWEKGDNGGAWDHIDAIEQHIGNVTIEDAEPSLEALAVQLRAIAIAADTAREIIHALQAKPSE